MNSTCKLIRELREQTGLTASQFAQVMGVSKSSVSKWENDEIPSVEHLYQIARYFRVTADELLNGALNSDGNIDKFAEEYDLSSFNVPKLIADKNVDELVRYYKKCQRIRNRFLKLLPRAAYQGLENIYLAEYKYISKYIMVNSNVIKYDLDFGARSSGKLDPNEMRAVREFYESIKDHSKAQKEWEIEKIYYFKPKLYAEEIISSNLFEPFVEMFKLLPQADKDNILNNTVNRCEPIAAFRNRYIFQMINNGAKILYRDAWNVSYWEDATIKAFEGKLEYIDKIKHVAYHDSKYYYSNGECSYAEYIDVVDDEKTQMLKKACYLRKTKPKEYYKQLKSGAFDYILDF